MGLPKMLFDIVVELCTLAGLGGFLLALFVVVGILCGAF